MSKRPTLGELHLFGVKPKRRRKKPRRKKKCGKGLRLAGQGLGVAGGRRKKKGKRKRNPWVIHVKKVSRRRGISYADALKVASPSYKA